MIMININRMLKSRRMRLAGHAARMGEKRNASILLVGKTQEEQKLALTWPTSVGHSVGIVRSWTQATEFLLIPDKKTIQGNDNDVT
jgi:hypothetical protein